MVMGYRGIVSVIGYSDWWFTINAWFIAFDEKACSPSEPKCELMEMDEVEQQA